MNAMLKITTVDNKTVWMTVREHAANELAELLKPNVNEVKIFKAGEMPLEELPTEIQTEIRDTLRAFSEVYAEYEHGRWHTTTCVCVRAEYADDKFSAGRYKANEVYTLEERKQNFFEEFGYHAAYMN